jgi:6-phosphogluconolactonase
LINEAEWIAFLVFGESKKNAMEEVIRGEKNPEEFPAQLIAPEEGELHWFIDEAAGAKLN